MNSQKSYNGQNALYLVPTPIGNLEDITFRALKVLKEADVVFSEDTRVTMNLMQHYHIKQHIYALHEHNEDTMLQKVLDYLKEGKTVAIVSDRGTPIISDPGYKCAKATMKAGFAVISLPGPTALIPALTSSGIEPAPFLFYGFLNSKESKQKKELELLKEYPFTMIFYEAPHRIKKTLSLMKNIFGNRNLSISREITKKFEEIYRGSFDELIDLISDPKGEFVIVVSGKKEEKRNFLAPLELVQQLLHAGYTEKDAVKEAAKQLQISKNEVYQQFLKTKKDR